MATLVRAFSASINAATRGVWSDGESVEPHRQAHDDARQTILVAREPSDLDGHPLDAIRRALHLERGQRACERSRRVADRQPDSPPSDINRKHTRHRSSYTQLLDPHDTQITQSDPQILKS